MGPRHIIQNNKVARYQFAGDFAFEDICVARPGMPQTAIRIRI
jgi:hypothetical protein